MPTIKPYTIADFSPHLFWDTEKSNLDFNSNKAQIIHQVLEYGMLSDWKIIARLYGIEEIASTCCSFRNLDPRALTFISTLSGIPLEKFRCYSTKQSIPPQCDF